MSSELEVGSIQKREDDFDTAGEEQQSGRPIRGGSVGKGKEDRRVGGKSENESRSRSEAR